MVSAVEQIYTCLWLAVISNACVPAVKSVLIDEYSVNALLHSMSVYSGYQSGSRAWHQRADQVDWAQSVVCCESVTGSSGGTAC